MKKTITIALILMMVLALAACGKDDSNTPAESGSTLTVVFTVS